MPKLQCLISVLKRAYISYYVIYMTASLTESESLQSISKLVQQIAIGSPILLIFSEENDNERIYNLL